MKFYDEEDTFGSDRDQDHEEKKRRAALYIRAHFDELMGDEAYKNAYDKMIDEFARDFSFVVNGKPLSTVSEKEREFENSALDMQILIKGREEIESYQADAIYIVEWMKAGKNLIVYV